MASDPFFLPWVGPDYSSGGIFGKKIMALGDSHYCGTPCGKCGINPNPKCNIMTSNVIGWYLDPECEREGWMNTYLKFERSLVGHATTHEESHAIWNSIVFYNFLQEALNGPRKAGTSEQHISSIEPFFSVLNAYKPDLLIVWGKRLWSHLPYENWIEGSEMQIDGEEIDNGYYKLSDGGKVKAVCIYHPSAAYDWSYWHRVISAAL